MRHINGHLLGRAVAENVDRKRNINYVVAVAWTPLFGGSWRWFSFFLVYFALLSVQVEDIFRSAKFDSDLLRCGFDCPFFLVDEVY